VFREDLLFRIAGITLIVPPLRERLDDIEPLARRFLAAMAPSPDLTAAALEALRGHHWPGNVRELKATIERAHVLSRGETIDARHLAFGIGIAGTAAARPASTTSDEAERARIEAALQACAGNQSRAAKQLGISRATLVRRLDALNISRPRR
jgi:DNA-binding NtrC family response regulator